MNLAVPFHCTNIYYLKIQDFLIFSNRKHNNHHCVNDQQHWWRDSYRMYRIKMIFLMIILIKLMRRSTNPLFVPDDFCLLTFL